MGKIQLTEERLENLVLESICEVLLEEGINEDLASWLGDKYQGLRGGLQNFKHKFNLSRAERRALDVKRKNKYLEDLAKKHTPEEMERIARYYRDPSEYSKDVYNGRKEFINKYASKGGTEAQNTDTQTNNGQVNMPPESPDAQQVSATDGQNTGDEREQIKSFFDNQNEKIKNGENNGQWVLKNDEWVFQKNNGEIFKATESPYQTIRQNGEAWNKDRMNMMNRIYQGNLGESKMSNKKLNKIINESIKKVLNEDKLKKKKLKKH